MMLGEKREKKEQFREAGNRIIPLIKQRESETFGKDAVESWETVNRRIEVFGRRDLFRRRRALYLAAAAVVLLLIIGEPLINLFSGNTHEERLSGVIAQLPAPDTTTQEIILLTSDSRTMNIENNANIKYNSDGSVVLNAETTDQSMLKEEVIETTYDQIVVPKGKRTSISFADGTRMYVNSGTRVVFPSRFANDKREIYVEGEIYIEVERDEARPFYVKTKNMDVRVLGTTFNVCAYEEDLESSVVLVSGEVEVETREKEKVVLAPDELFSMNRNGTSIHKVDVFDYTCWTQNMIIFNKEPLDKILGRLARYYDKKIIWNADLSKMTVSGKLDLRDEPEDVMNIIASIAPITFTGGDAIRIELKK